jgi:hypothetical protein
VAFRYREHIGDIGAAGGERVFGTSVVNATSSATFTVACTSAVSAICGTCFGDTKAPASIRFMPAPARPSMMRTLVSVGIHVGTT